MVRGRAGGRPRPLTRRLRSGLVLDVVLIGAGLRGMVSYGTNAEEAGVRFVAVVEPLESRREAFGDLHEIPAAHRYPDVDAWLAGPRLADAVLVATPDDQHLEPALAALRAGCHVLLEKPMAPTLEGCAALVEAAEDRGVELHVCHVLRYTPFFRAVADIVRSGRLGRLVTVDHRENVDALHMAHSYVRGAYRRTDAGNPMLLAKSCHDLDVLHWVLDDPVVRLSSFGSLLHFRPESVGPEIPERCTDGCPVEVTCAFSALAAYAPDEPVTAPEIRLLTQVFPLADPPTFDRASRRRALETSPYGRCALSSNSILCAGVSRSSNCPELTPFKKASTKPNPSSKAIGTIKINTVICAPPARSWRQSIVYSEA